jgi:hypothetical protein
MKIDEKITNSLSIDEAIETLHQKGYSIIDTMKFLVSEYSISLAEAKEATSNHQVWNNEVLAAKEMHEDIIEGKNKHRRSFLKEPSLRIKIKK